MRVAVLADIHANLAALEAISRVLERERPDDIIVLGDLVGYNANPKECLQVIRERRWTSVLGNHDHDAAYGSASIGTHNAARQAQQWTRAQLDSRERVQLMELPRIVVRDWGMVAVHGCYLNDSHFTGYVTSTMLEANLRVVSTDPRWPQVAVCGHTHTPMIGWVAEGTVEERRLGESVTWPRSADAVLINPGAVGQPRDGDPRASFAMVELTHRTAQVYRVPYDIERTCAEIERAGLPLELAQRLRQGR